MLCLPGAGRCGAGRRANGRSTNASRRTNPSQAITGPYRQLHPEDNNERQQIHEHALNAPTKRARPDRTASAVGTDRRRLRALCGASVLALRHARPPARCSAPPPSRSSPTSRPRPASVPPQQRRLRQEVPAGDARLGRGLPRLRQRRLAGHPVRELDATGRDRPAPPSYSGALPQQPQRDVHRRHRGRPGSRSRCTAWASSAADYDNDGRVDIYVTALGPQSSVPQPRRREVRGRDGAGRASATRASRRARRGSTTTATASSISSSRNYVDWSPENRSVLHARRQDRSRTARRNRTRARARRSITTGATAPSRT